MMSIKSHVLGWEFLFLRQDETVGQFCSSAGTGRPKGLSGEAVSSSGLKCLQSVNPS